MTVPNTRASRMAFAASRRPARATRPQDDPIPASTPPAARGGRKRGTALLSAEVHGDRQGLRAAHDDALTIDLCDCRSCIEERRRRSSHPLLRAALLAFLDTGDVLHTLRVAHGCAAGCDQCNDARMVWAVLAPVEESFVGEIARDATLAERRAQSDRTRDKPRHRRRWHPDSSGNFPPVGLAVLSLMNLGDALDALHDGHGCGNECWPCQQAEVASWLLPMLTAAVEAHMKPDVNILRRRGVSPAGAQVLRLYDQLETSLVRAAGG